MDWNRLKESFSQLKENDSQLKSTSYRSKSILRHKRPRDNNLVKRRKLWNKNYCKLNVTLNCSSPKLDEDLLELCTGTLDDYNLNSTSIKLNAEYSRDIQIRPLEFRVSSNENTRQVPKFVESVPNKNSRKSFESINSHKVLGNSNWNSILPGSKLSDHDESILTFFNEHEHDNAVPGSSRILIENPLKNVIAESDDCSSNDTLIGSPCLRENLLIEDDESSHSNGTESSSDLLKSFCSDDSFGTDDPCIIDDSEKIKLISSPVVIEGASQKSVISSLESNTQKSSNNIEYYSSTSFQSSNSSNATLIDLFPSPLNNIDRKNTCTELDLLLFDIQKDLNKKSNSKLRKIKGGYLDKFRKIQKSNQSTRIFWINELENRLIQPSNTFKIVSIKETYNIKIVSIENVAKFKCEIIINMKSCKKNDLLVGNYINVEFDYDSYEVNNLQYILGVNKFVKE